MPDHTAHEALALEDAARETVELLPRRSALGHGINITTITGVNIAIAVNAGTIHGQAWAAAWQGIGAHA
jgi:hypothetical protein